MPEENLKATAVVKNKFWIVEQDGKKVATIQTTEDGVVWVDGSSRREKFATIKMLRDRHNVEFDRTHSHQPQEEPGVYGYPVQGRYYNELYDVTRRVPIYTTKPRSKSYYCAGYYLVQMGNSWIREFCPKLIALQRYQFQGPFRTEQEQIEQLRKSHG